MPTQGCPLCKRDAMRFPVSGGFDGFGADCDRCGKFRMTRQLERNLETAPAEERALLLYVAAYVRRMNAQGGARPLLGTNNWEEFARAHATTPVHEKISRLLALLGARSQPGQLIPFDLDLEAPLIAGGSRPTPGGFPA